MESNIIKITKYLVDYTISIKDNYAFITSNIKHPFITKLNLYSITNNLTAQQLLERLIKYVDKEHITKPPQKIEYNIYKKYLLQLCYYNENRIKLNIFIEQYLQCWQMENINVTLLDDTNIFIWKVDFNMSRKNFNGIVSINFKFDTLLFLDMPPEITVTYPIFDPMFLLHLSKIKTLNKKYWTHAKSYKNMIQSIVDIVQEHGIIISTNIKCESLSKHLNKFYDIFSQIDENPVQFEVNKKFVDFTQSVHKKTNCPIKYGKTGTGYGFVGATKWDIDEYINYKNNTLKEHYEALENIESDINIFKNKKELYKLLKSSLLIPYLINSLINASALDIEKNPNIYTLYYSLLYSFSDINMNKLYKINYKNYTLLEAFCKFVSVCKNIIKFTGIVTLYNINKLAKNFIELYDNVSDLLIDPSYTNKQQVSVTTETSLQDRYVNS
jgi:hypothetical protein